MIPIIVVILMLIGGFKPSSPDEKTSLGPCSKMVKRDCVRESACRWDSKSKTCFANCGFYTGQYDNQKACEAWGCKWRAKNVGGWCE